MTKTVAVEGDVNSVDTLTRLTTQGSVSAPSLVVPKGVSRIKKVTAAVGVDQAAAGSAVFFVRLGGAAVQGGEQTLMFAASGNAAVQTGSDQAPSALASFEMDVDIEVIADVISISTEMAGSDLGDSTIIVGLIYG